MAGPTFPKVVHDFYKSNGSDTVYNTEGPSLTRQEFAEECDINKLMSRYDAHVIGGPGNMSAMGPMYADFTQLPVTLMDYMDTMQRGEAAFMSLPAHVRREFDNSPHMFVDFASDPENLPQMRTWGLAPPLAAVLPAAGSSVAPIASAPASGAPGAAAPGAPQGASTHGST